MKVLLKMCFIVLVLALTVTGSALPSYAADAQALSGKVVQTMDSGGYTYAQIENKGVKTWIAVPQTKVVKGQNISFAPGAGNAEFREQDPETHL